MTILFTLHLYFAVGLFLNKKTHIIDVLGVIVFLEVSLGYESVDRSTFSMKRFMLKM